MRRTSASARERPSRGFTLVVAAGLVAAWICGALIAFAAFRVLNTDVAPEPNAPVVGSPER